MLIVSLTLGTVVAGCRTKQALRAELGAGLTGAAQTVASAFEDLPNSDHPMRDLRQLVKTFDGNRHVHATLLDGDGRTVFVSQTRMTGSSAPPWFRNLLGPAPAGLRIHVPDAIHQPLTIVLSPISEIDIASAWGDLWAVIAVLTTSAAVGLVLVNLVIGTAFRPLKALSAQFAQIGTGDYSGQVAEEGPSEIRRLQHGFNAMAGRLAGATARNRLLTDQLSTIQDEERADIARDLHDEIGPHLFAVNMDAEMIAQLNDAGRTDAIPDRILSIQAAVGHMQHEVRDLLGRLRPARVTEFGLNTAILDLSRFWRSRRADITFTLSLLDDEGRLPDATKEAAYRVVQEAVNNAVRHGHPRTVEVAMKVLASGDLAVQVVDDGASSPMPHTAGGLGLIGMGERVAALGGTLGYGPTPGRLGWTVDARLPLEAQASVRPPMEIIL